MTMSQGMQGSVGTHKCRIRIPNLYLNHEYTWSITTIRNSCALHEPTRVQGDFHAQIHVHGRSIFASVAHSIYVMIFNEIIFKKFTRIVSRDQGKNLSHTAKSPSVLP